MIGYDIMEEQPAVGRSMPNDAGRNQTAPDVNEGKERRWTV